MLQERELVPLMERLLARGYTLLLETSGERPLEHVPPAVHKIVDVKCPGSGEGGTFRLSNLAVLTDADEVKFVLSDPRGLRVCARLHPRTRVRAEGGGSFVFSGIFKKPKFGSRHEQLPARSASFSGMDIGRRTQWSAWDCRSINSYGSPRRRASKDCPQPSMDTEVLR